MSYGAVTGSSTEEGEESASELNRKLTNPVSDIWSTSNQFNNFELNNGQWNNNWNFQSVLPVKPDEGLVRDNVIEGHHRPRNQIPIRPPGEFPTATSHFTDQGKWQLGPSVVVGYRTSSTSSACSLSSGDPSAASTAGLTRAR